MTFIASCARVCAHDFFNRSVVYVSVYEALAPFRPSPPAPIVLLSFYLSLWSVRRAGPTRENREEAGEDEKE